MAFVERDAQIAQLQDLFKEVSGDSGRLVFLGAEAGGGKSTLIERFSQAVRDRAPVTVISCDGLEMPGDYGTLHDFAGALDAQIIEEIDQHAPRERLFRTVLTAMQHIPVPNVFVGEDAHWTDEATLELMRFVGRRITSTKTLFIVTYRDDSLDAYHPLRRIIGDLINEPFVSRIALPPLSTEATRLLAADTGLDPLLLHERTGGNPFFVQEMVANRSGAMPDSIRDAVLARAIPLSDETRSVIDVAAALGVSFNLDRLERVAGSSVTEAVEAALRVGILRANGDDLAFAHDITRDVFLQAMSPPRRRGLHRRILEVLETPSPGPDLLPHLAYHAEEARAADAVLRYAPVIARHAARQASHREAIDQYTRALRFRDQMPRELLAALLEERSYECYLIGRLDEAIADRMAAIAIHRESGDILAAGDGSRWLSRYSWFAGDRSAAERYGREALDLLEPLEHGPALAMACSNYSQLRMLAYDSSEAIAWGERAIALANELGDEAILAHALTNVGSARSAFGDAANAELRRGLSLALELGLNDDAARTYANLSYVSLEHYQLADASQFIEGGIAFTAEHDLLAMELYLRALKTQLLLIRGQWRQATDLALHSASHPRASTQTKIFALTVAGLAAARAGDPSDDLLDEALRLAELSGELMRLCPVRAARAEAAWLAGDPELAAAEAGHEFDAVLKTGERWLAGRLGIWLHRSGHPVQDATQLAEPYALEITGKADEAFDIWRSRGAGLEAARALAATGSADALLEALSCFDRLGAKPDAAHVTRLLRGLGVQHVPRGPRASTRGNAALLTGRELEIIALLVQGRTNREIADELFLSPRTVGHHVSAILAKLEIASRRDVLPRAIELDLVQSRSSASPK